MTASNVIRSAVLNIFSLAVFLARIGLLVWVCYATLTTVLVITVIQDVIVSGKHISTEMFPLEELTAFPEALLQASVFVAVLVAGVYFLLVGRSPVPLPAAWQRQVDRALDAFADYVNPRADRVANAVWQKITAQLSRIEWWYKGRLVARALKKSGFVQLKPGMDLPPKSRKS